MNKHRCWLGINGRYYRLIGDHLSPSLQRQCEGKEHEWFDIKTASSDDLESLLVYFISVLEKQEDLSRGIQKLLRKV